MLALMPTRGRKTTGDKSRPQGTKDVFARASAELVDRFDELVDAMEPATSRSAVIVMLIQRFVEERWAEHEKKAR